MRPIALVALLSSLSLLAALPACHSTGNGGAPSLEREDERAPDPPEGIAPQPYTAAAIRASHPVGTYTSYRIQSQGAPPVLQRTEWVECDGERCVMEARTSGTEDSQRAEARWWELRDHASFPAAATTITREPLTIAAGTFDAMHYAIAVPAAEGGGTRHFWFDRATAGSPLLFTQETGGAETFRMELLATNRL